MKDYKFHILRNFSKNAGLLAEQLNLQSYYDLPFKDRKALRLKILDTDKNGVRGAAIIGIMSLIEDATNSIFVHPYAHDLIKQNFEFYQWVFEDDQELRSQLSRVIDLMTPAPFVMDIVGFLPPIELRMNVISAKDLYKNVFGE